MGTAVLVDVGVLMAAMSSGGCSAFLDWSGYTGGNESDAGDASDEQLPPSEAGADAATCATTCLGCCNALGRCAPGMSTGACGTSGGSCSDCSLSGGTCIRGTCATKPPVDSGPTCTDEACKGVGYSCGGVTQFYKPLPCCQAKSGICGCTPDPTGSLQGACGPKI